VSLFVVVFAVYPFAAEMFRQGDMLKRLISGTIALGAFTFTMDALPGTPQIQNIIPSTFFKTTTWAAPWLGTIGAVFILMVGLLYLIHCRKAAFAAGEGYGTDVYNEPEPVSLDQLAHPLMNVVISVSTLAGVTGSASGGMSIALVCGRVCHHRRLLRDRHRVAPAKWGTYE